MVAPAQVSLARKLGVRPGDVLCLRGAPAGWTVPDPPPGVRIRARGRADVLVAFVRRRSALAGAVATAERVFPDGALWVAWPRRAGGHTSDVTDEAVREAALPVGLVDVKVAALDGDWSALRLVWRRELRGSGPLGG